MFKVSIQVLYQTLDRERLYCGLELAREGQWGLNWTYKEELCYYYLLHAYRVLGTVLNALRALSHLKCLSKCTMVVLYI